MRDLTDRLSKVECTVERTNRRWRGLHTMLRRLRRRFKSQDLPFSIDRIQDEVNRSLTLGDSYSLYNKLKKDTVNYTISGRCTPMIRTLYTDQVQLYMTFILYVWSKVSKRCFVSHIFRVIIKNYNWYTIFPL